MSTHPTAWKLWRSQFTDGEEVIVLDEDEQVWRGRHEATDDHLVIHPGTVLEVRIEWVNVAFVAHDGFPARKLMGADGSRTAEMIETTDVTAALRQLFHVINLDAEQPAAVDIAFSDPWLIEGAEGVLHFSGNDGPEHWVEDEEEVLVLRAGDGARALLWSVGSVFHFEDKA